MTSKAHPVVTRGLKSQASSSKDPRHPSKVTCRPHEAQEFWAQREGYAQFPQIADC